MQAKTISRVLTWVYVTTLVAATGFGVWAGLPYIQAQRAARGPTLAVDVYSHAFIPVFKDTPFAGRGPSAVDNFFGPEVFQEAVAAFVERQPAPLPKGADSEAWRQEAASSLTTSVNNYMGRRYRDALERMYIANDAKGVILVRIENLSAAPVDEIRLEVAGGQLFMEGPAASSKLRSLGARAMRVGALAPGAKAELFVLTTQDMSPGAEAPAVKVTAKDQTFPVTVHAQNAPLRPTLRDAGWIAFAALYLALILAGVVVGMLSLMGVRFAVVVAGRKPMPIASEPPASAVFTPPAPLSDAELKAWQRPA